MAATTTVSAWGKPGAWALDSEEHEEELNRQQQEQQEKKKEMIFPSQPLSDFPSLSAAAVTKTKKKKPQSVSLSEFTTGKNVSHGSAKAPVAASAAKGLTPDELLILPTGPRERSSEELERSSSRLGGGFRSYGYNSASDKSGNPRYASNGVGDDSSSRWGSRDRGSTTEEPSSRRNAAGFNRDSLPSKADEIDDWGAAKKSIAPPAFERRERGSGAGFFDSQSRADESDSWLSKKSFVTSPEPRKMGGGFERERRAGGFEKEMTNGFGGGADSDNWGKKRGGDEAIENGRPRLVLQPRSLSLSNGEHPQPVSGSVPKSNPFGAARPREEVLKDKGQDWKKIDEQLESVKIKEMSMAANDGAAFGKKSSGNGNGHQMSSPEARTERSWRKADSVESDTPSEEKS